MKAVTRCAAYATLNRLLKTVCFSVARFSEVEAVGAAVGNGTSVGTAVGIGISVGGGGGGSVAGGGGTLVFVAIGAGWSCESGGSFVAVGIHIRGGLVRVAVGVSVAVAVSVIVAVAEALSVKDAAVGKMMGLGEGELV